MKLQRTFACIAGVFFAVSFVTSQAGAKTPRWCTGSRGNLVEIEVNAIRAGAKTVSAGPNQSRDVTAKARILKGTAVSSMTIDMWLTIEAVDGADVISTNSAGPIRIGVGKGGKGAKLSLDIPQCKSGSISFIATFSGVDAENDPCEGTREIRKECK